MCKTTSCGLFICTLFGQNAVKDIPSDPHHLLGGSSEEWGAFLCDLLVPVDRVTSEACRFIVK